MSVENILSRDSRDTPVIQTPFVVSGYWGSNPTNPLPLITNQKKKTVNSFCCLDLLYNACNHCDLRPMGPNQASAMSFTYVTAIKYI